MIKTVNLKSDMPSVSQSLDRLERELALARNEKAVVLKVIHGYGSKGLGGDIRIAAQKRLRELGDAGAIRGCIFGEEWSKSNADVWRLLQQHPAFKNDPDLGMKNRGITIVLL